MIYEYVHIAIETLCFVMSLLQTFTTYVKWWELILHGSDEGVIRKYYSQVSMYWDVHILILVIKSNSHQGE